MYTFGLRQHEPPTKKFLGFGPVIVIYHSILWKFFVNIMHEHGNNSVPLYYHLKPVLYHGTITFFVRDVLLIFHPNTSICNSSASWVTEKDLSAPKIVWSGNRGVTTNSAEVLDNILPELGPAEIYTQHVLRLYRLIMLLCFSSILMHTISCLITQVTVTCVGCLKFFTFKLHEKPISSGVMWWSLVELDAVCQTEPQNNRSTLHQSNVCAMLHSGIRCFKCLLVSNEGPTLQILVFDGS